MTGLVLLGLSATAAWADVGASSAPATRPALSPTSGPGARPADASSASPEHIAELIARLGSDKYADRESAGKELIEIGGPALAALKAAALDRNPERASRAEKASKTIEENLISPEMYRAKIAAVIESTNDAERQTAGNWIHQRMSGTVPYLLDLAPKVAGERAVRLHLLMFDAWQAGVLSDDQKTQFVSRSVRVGLRVDQGYWPGGSRIAVLEVMGLANMTPNDGWPSSKPWGFLKATWTAELDGTVLARGKTWTADETYLMLPDGLRPGIHRLKATVELAELEGPWGLKLAADAVLTALADAPRPATAPAGPQPARITGRVVDEKGNPIANVPVSARSSTMGEPIYSAFTANARSDKQGRFELSVPFDDILYQIVLGSYGVYHLSEPAQVIPSESKPVKLVLKPDAGSHIVRGKVAYPGGGSAGGLEVALIGEYDRRCQATTDANGNFRTTIQGHMGQAVAIVRNGDLAAPLKVVEIDGNAVLALTLEPTSSIEGVVRDENDQTPVPGATVLVQPYFANSFRMETTTGKDGRYALGGIPAGSYLVRVASTAKHFHRTDPWRLPSATPAAGESKEVNIDLQRLVLLRGKVVDHAGRPVAGAMVAVATGGVYNRQYGCVRSGGDGGFIITTGVTDESLTVAAYRSDKGLAMAQTRLLQPGQISDGLVLRTGGTVRVRAAVSDPQGKPVRDVQCLLESRTSVSQYTGADGWVDLGRVALSSSGTAIITFRSPRPNYGQWKRYEVKAIQGAPTFYLHQGLSVKLQPGEDQDLKITLKPTPLQRISGTVVDGTGRPVAGADVNLLTGDANEQTWIRTVRPQFRGGGSIDYSPRTTVIGGARTGPDGRWTIWTVREDGVGWPSGGNRTDWTRYCVGVLGPGNKNLLVRDVVVPEGDSSVDLLVDLDAGKSQSITTQPAAKSAARAF